MNVPSAVKFFCKLVSMLGGRALLVGGCVRDHHFGLVPKDWDIEVYGLQFRTVHAIAAATGSAKASGRQFGTIQYRIGSVEMDLSIPRRDNKRGIGHKGFDSEFDPFMGVADAALRRDFRMNSMAYDPLTGELFDVFRGQDDIRQKVLRATSAHFAEDPLRLLRAGQFIGRLGLRAHKALIATCRKLRKTLVVHSVKLRDDCERKGVEYIHVDRVWGEMKKLLLSERPSRGLEFLRKVGWVEYQWPELHKLIGLKQNPDWHPEGDVWTHTMYVVDYAPPTLVARLAALCHDLGKPETCVGWRCEGHASAGVARAENFMWRIGVPPDIQAQVLPLVKEHMTCIGIDKPTHQLTDAAIRRLALRLAPATLEQLADMIYADTAGCWAPEKALAVKKALLGYAHRLNVANSVPEKIVKGRHVLPRFPGRKPGPWVGAIIDNLFDRQLEGEFKTLEEGLKLLDELV